MPDIDRERLRTLTENATPGPWVYSWRAGGVTQDYDLFAKTGESTYEGVGIVPDENVRVHDAEFIAAAREAIPALLDALERAEGIINRQVGLRERADEAEARLRAVEAAVDYAELHGNPEVWTHDIRRALDGDA